MDVYFVLTPQFLMLDFAGPAEAFRLAAGFGAPFKLHMVSPTPDVSSSLGLSVSGVAPLPMRLPADSLVIVSGNCDSAMHYQMPEAQRVIQWLSTVCGPRQRVASICSGALLLARAGLLDGRRATTHHTLIDRLRAEAPMARVDDDRIFVEDGPVCTSAGITAGVDLALHLIEREAGSAVAQQVAREMVVYLRRSGADPQLSPWLDHRNHLHPAVHRVQDAIIGEPHRPWSLADLADMAHMSVRNLTRLFKQHAGLSVLDYQQRIRIAYARQLLENPRHTVERVAELAGFGSARDFRRVWAKFEEAPPSEIRAEARTRLAA